MGVATKKKPSFAEASEGKVKAGIFDPYLDTVGGGERYAMTVAEALLKKDWQVDIFWPDRGIKENLMKKFSLEIDRVNFVPYSPRVNNLFNRYKKEKEYGFLFYFSDGSVPFMFGKKNVLHFQVPFKNVLDNIWSKIKLLTVDYIVCNSEFTKKNINHGRNDKITIVYPPVDIDKFSPKTKENIILSVGRFSQLLQSKKQDVLVEAFKSADKKKIKGWKLILAGGAEIGGKEFLEKLKKEAANFPIEIIENPPFRKLSELYSKAKIFWIASGYGVDEEINPEKVEHFGMTTVEAMASGCVSIAQKKGGQKEIIENGVDGYLWIEVDELLNLTYGLIEDENKLTDLREMAINKSKLFSKEKFFDKIYNLIEQ